MTYLIYFGNESYTVSGDEAAWAAYNSARVFAYMVDGGPVVLVNGETGEVIADSSDD